MIFLYICVILFFVIYKRWESCSVFENRGLQQITETTGGRWSEKWTIGIFLYIVTPAWCGLQKSQKCFLLSLKLIKINIAEKKSLRASFISETAKRFFFLCHNLSGKIVDKGNFLNIGPIACLKIWFVAFSIAGRNASDIRFQFSLTTSFSESSVKFEKHVTKLVLVKVFCICELVYI